MGLFKLLLTGEDDELDFDALVEEETLRLEDTQILSDTAVIDRCLESPTELLDAQEDQSYLSATRNALECEIAETRQRDELLAQVGQLHLAVESVLRLLIDKKVITDLDLRRMIEHVDHEDGLSDGEDHGDRPKVPDYCPKCEARITPGKRMCVLCGQRF